MPRAPVTFEVEVGRETDEKAERVAKVARDHGAGGVLLITQPNVAWLTGGSTNRIDGSREAGAGALLITADGRRYVVANAIEMPRLAAEVVEGLSFEPAEYPWIEDQANPAKVAEVARSLLPSGASLAADWFFPETSLVEASLRRSRVPLLDEEIARYRTLGRDIGRVVGDVCRNLQPGITEDRVASLVSAAICGVGARPIVVLVAADDRLARYRHPVPTRSVWRDVLMVVVCGERHGLVVALTRIVSTGQRAELQHRTRATARVFERLLDSTRAGATGADLYAVAARAYADVGFAGEEKRHHQGGATGYRSREWIAHPASQEIVAPRQAFAWNPSITGTKIEDTVLFVDGACEMLTESPAWPTLALEVQGTTLQAADILIRS
jgi:Xaa-Pro aminopeptidase